MRYILYLERTHERPKFIINTHSSNILPKGTHPELDYPKNLTFIFTMTHHGPSWPTHHESMIYIYMYIYIYVYIYGIISSIWYIPSYIYIYIYIYMVFSLWSKKSHISSRALHSDFHSCREQSVRKHLDFPSILRWKDMGRSCRLSLQIHWKIPFF